ncbi:hypothetical protein HBI56_073360 [Parastagonospora nodorum]|nr:hypothetical protein HBH53_145510 [Parastagonospora nodorum]KAH4003602.1 hypothetical protein HBI10_056750 [Parastagonospora nodorum]KAH4029185.1 hypothetical protein HBI13_045580 [Parastagonospora nodorum]KAH4038085.1 hypothetical protein HBI09_062830 [Parastagonospora nodorum]KAH4054390.1 hypothetical protein HBH49_079640 [Parastagonospora nodorum]
MPAMDPQHTAVPFSARHSILGQQQSPNTTPVEYEYTYNEKDDYSRSQQRRADRGSKTSSYGRGRDSVISHPFSPKQSPSPRSSLSSGDKRRHSSIPQNLSPTLVNDAQNIRRPPQAHLDPEKHGYGSSKPHRHSGSARSDEAVYDQGQYHEGSPEEKTWQLLFYLSGPCALLSIVITLWTIVALFISLALAPLKLCSTRPSLSTQLTTFLAPALNLQLHLVYSHNSAQNYSAPMLVVIHLFSPLIAFGVAIAAFTAALFWFFSSILGDPGGHDGHNDGKESILGVRKWWERWLSRGLR